MSGVHHAHCECTTYLRITLSFCCWAILNELQEQKKIVRCRAQMNPTPNGQQAAGILRVATQLGDGDLDDEAEEMAKNMK